MADDSDQIGQDEIEQLLRQAQDTGKTTKPTKDIPTELPPQAEEPSSLDQDEIERLMAGGSQAPATTEAPAMAPSSGSTATATQSDDNTAVSQSDVELLLNKAEQALASVDEHARSLPEGVQVFQFQNFSGTAANTEAATLELMRDVQLDMTIELGRTQLHLEDVLKLKQGTVVPLDKLAGDPADIYVNGRLVARGEVLVLNDNFCVRVAELIVGESACA